MKVFSKAFTLAEVLLTLAIIGVVAALTIPAVITKVQQDQYVVGLKKAYSTLKSVEREAKQEHGEMENWDWSGDGPATFEKYFKPHFDILQDCGATTEEGCFSQDRTVLNGDIWDTDLKTTSHYRIVTSDTMAWVYAKAPNAPTATSRRGYLFVDVNGLKGPNIFGRDIFAFNVFPSNLGFKPHASYEDDTGLLISTSESNAACRSGGFCSTKVLTEGAMNY